MTYKEECEVALGKIERYALENPEAIFTVVFPEGDSYECMFETSDWDSNDEDPGSQDYDEWFALLFNVAKVLVEGPNNDPAYMCLDVSEKHMPSKVYSGETALFEQE